MADLKEIRLKARAIIENSDLNTVSVKNIRVQIEQDTGKDLSDIKKQVGEIIKDEFDKVLALSQEPVKEEQSCQFSVSSSQYIGTSNLSEPFVEEDIKADNHMTDEQYALYLHNQELQSSRRATRNKNTKPAVVRPKAAKKKTDGEKKRNGGFNKPLQLSAQLSALFGKDIMSRSEVVKNIWVYIRAKNLQDPTDKRFIICDEALKIIMGTNRVNIFKMNRLLSSHMYRPEDIGSKHPSESLDELSDSDIDASQESKMTLSDDLFAICGSRKLQRPKVVEEIWNYVKLKDLQDPLDKQYIICDEKLKSVFKCDRIDSFKINSAIKDHLSTE